MSAESVVISKLEKELVLNNSSFPPHTLQNVIFFKNMAFFVDIIINLI